MSEQELKNDHLKIWEQIHGFPLTLGLKVRLSDSAKKEYWYSDDWNQDYFVIVGLSYNSYPSNGCLNITITDGPQLETVTDGFDIYDLMPYRASV